MMRTLTRYSLSAALTLTLAATSTPASAIIGGRLVPQTAYPAVVGLLYASDGELEAGCTGTLVAPRIVLTAAHCLGGLESGDRPVAVRFGTADLAAPGRDLRVVGTHAAGEVGAGLDLGLIELERDAPVRPMPILGRPDGLRPGEPLVHVGFGVSDDGTFGRLRAVRLEIAIAACRDPLLGCEAGGSWIVASPAGMCGGDSGGPVFVERAQRLYLVGVASGPTSDEPSDDCGDWRRSLFARPDSIPRWLSRRGVPMGP